MKITSKECLICGKMFKVRDVNKNSSSKFKKRRTALYTCSKSCARRYDFLQSHFRYILKKNLKDSHDKELKNGK